MSAESILLGLLEADATLVGLVGSRIHADALPERAVYPAVVYSRAGTEPIEVLDGSEGAELAAITIECWANTREQAYAVANAVRTLLRAADEPADGMASMVDLAFEKYGYELSVTLLVE